MSEFPDVLPVVHPVPMRFLPRRGRSERMGLAQATTPVRLTRIAQEGISSALPGRIPGGMSVNFVRIEGRVFAKATAPDGPDARAPDFADYLLRSDLDARTTQMALAFAGTPVSAMLRAHDGDGRAWPIADADHRGVPGLADEAREVTFDGTGAACTALQDFFDRNVRVKGRTVYVDTGGPLFTPTRDRWRSLTYRTNLHPRMRALPADDGIGSLTRAEVIEIERIRLGEDAPLRDPDAPPAPGLMRLNQLGRGVATDTDLLFANTAPGELLDVMAPAIRLGSRGPMGEPGTRAGIERLRWMALRGSVGSIEVHEAPEVLAHVSKVAMWALTMPQARREGVDNLVNMRAHISKWIEPRQAGAFARIDDEDASALDGLAP